MTSIMSASGENQAGLMSSAGLVRYFDSEEDRGYKINPKTCLIASVLFGILVRAAALAI